jgi:hypothetical protein
MMICFYYICMRSRHSIADGHISVIEPLSTNFVMSVWMLGYFVRLLFVGTLSELYDRLLVYIVCKYSLPSIQYCDSCCAIGPIVCGIPVFDWYVRSKSDYYLYI